MHLAPRSLEGSHLCAPSKSIRFLHGDGLRTTAQSIQLQYTACPLTLDTYPGERQYTIHILNVFKTYLALNMIMMYLERDLAGDINIKKVNFSMFGNESALHAAPE